MTHIHDFLADSRGERNFPFGQDAASTAAGLRKLADEIDAGRILPQSAVLRQSSCRDDFAHTRLLLTFVEEKARS